MCVPSVYRLKYFISIGIVVTLLIGISLLYVLVYSFIISSVTIQVQTGFRTVLISVFLSTSLLMVLSSLSGIYGLLRKKNKFVIFYAVTMLLYMISFVTLGVGTAKTPQYISSQCDSDYTSDYELTFQAGRSLLCKLSCQCYFTNSQKFSEQEIIAMGIINSNDTDSSLPINVENCETWDMTQYTLTNQMSWLQMFFNCAGWCTSSPYYVFSNINFGSPNGACVESVSAFLSKFGLIIMITSFAVGGFILAVLVIICCLWLHPDRGLKYDSLEMFKRPFMIIHEQKEESRQGIS